MRKVLFVRLSVLLLAAVPLAPTAHATDFNDPCEKLGADIFMHANGYVFGLQRVQEAGCYDQRPEGGYSPECVRLRERTMGKPWDKYWEEKKAWTDRQCQTHHCLHLNFLKPWLMGVLAVNPAYLCSDK